MPGRDDPSAAGEGPAAGSRPAPVGALDGTAWILARYRDGGGIADVPAGVHADARFADGRVAGSAGCNRYIGACTVDGETIAFGPLATTRMACPDDALAEQERAYLAALAAAVRWSVRGDRLELRDAAGALQAMFARA